MGNPEPLLMDESESEKPLMDENDGWKSKKKQTDISKGTKSISVGGNIRLVHHTDTIAGVHNNNVVLAQNPCDGRDSRWIVHGSTTFGLGRIKTNKQQRNIHRKGTQIAFCSMTLHTRDFNTLLPNQGQNAVYHINSERNPTSKKRRKNHKLWKRRSSHSKHRKGGIERKTKDTYCKEL